MNATHFAILAAVLFAGSAVHAADAADADGAGKQADSLKGGKVLQEAYILDKKPNGITLAYRDGCMFIKFSDMPSEYQKAFGYDPIKSAIYELKLAEQKKALEMDEAEQKAKAMRLREEEDKHYKDSRINIQQRKVRELEFQLEEAKKRLASAEKTAGQDGNALGMSTISSKQVIIESPWGYGGRIQSGMHNAAVTSKLMKEVDPTVGMRDKLAQEVNDLQLKLEAAQNTLDTLIQNSR